MDYWRSSQEGPKYYALKLRENSSSTPRWNYDVFLSFRGEDTRKTFSDHLYTALVRAGIHTFRDDDELPRGQDISSELLKAIEESRIAIVVFSKDFASSRWCLDELVKILDCKKMIGQLVFPVFYDVNVADVCQQTGSFEASFARHEERFNPEKVNAWRVALTEAATLEGWDLQKDTSRSESEFIEKIVREVLYKVSRKLYVAKHPVGLNSRLEKLQSLLESGSDGVRVVGIYGNGGIGKTTLAKAFYNSVIHQYEGSCFLASVGEESKQFNGLICLQQQLLYELHRKNHEIASVEKGIDLIKGILGSRRVLVVLDDLDHLSQLDALAGHPSWFGQGSLIVMTTRDENLLDRAKVDIRYEVKELNHEESLMLFSWHAFKNPVPLQNYKQFSHDIVNYTGRVPLTLEVVGSSLVDKAIEEWKSMLKKLEEKSSSLERK